MEFACLVYISCEPTVPRLHPPFRTVYRIVPLGKRAVNVTSNFPYPPQPRIMPCRVWLSRIPRHHRITQSVISNLKSVLPSLNSGGIECPN